MRKIFYIPIILIALLFSASVFAEAVPGLTDVLEDPILDTVTYWVVGEGSARGQLNVLFRDKILVIARMIIVAIAVIYMVVAGGKMVFSSDDEASLTKSKRSLYYIVLGLILVTIPEQVSLLFSPLRRIEDLNTTNVTGDIGSTFDDVTRGCNLVFCPDQWTEGVGAQIISFFEVGLVGAGLFMMTLSAFLLISSWGNEERRKKARNGFLYGTIALVMVGFFEAWVRFSATLNFQSAQANIVSKLFNFLLLLAAPVAIVFLIIGAYHWITSGGDEEKIKKGKTIITNTFFGVIILLGSYAFLNDLVTLF